MYNTNLIFKNLKHQGIFFCLLFVGFTSNAQTINYNNLPLKEALEIGIKNNKNLKISQLRNKMSETKEKDLKMDRLPDLNFHASYLQVTELYQHENGVFNKATEYDAINAMYDFTISASIPLYMGGKLKYREKKAALDTEISKLKTHQNTRELKLQIITAYLQILHLKEQQDLLNEKMKEDSANIKQVKLLKNNGVVTYNEVLRTSLQLSKHKMSWTELDNSVQIAEHLLKTLLALPENQTLHADTSQLLSNKNDSKYISELTEFAINNDEKMSISQNMLRKKLLDQKIIKANNLPSISLGGEYFMKYPNMMFFPPTPYAYRLGMIGVNLSYPIANLYKNKYKLEEAKEEIHLAKLEIEETEEQLTHQVFEANKKLEETTEKVSIAEEAILQAQENYRIVKMKYANKLSLITELIDADNAFLEAQSQLISIKINRQLKYYQLQYVIGNL